MYNVFIEDPRGDIWYRFSTTSVKRAADKLKEFSEKYNELDHKVTMRYEVM